MIPCRRNNTCKGYGKIFGDLGIEKMPEYLQKREKRENGIGEGWRGRQKTVSSVDSISHVKAM